MRRYPSGMPGLPIDVCFVAPEIPGNTGNAIRLAALTGAHLHLVRPLGFELTDAHLRRAGLDYHDLAVTTVHDDLEAMFEAVRPARTFAFTGRGDIGYAEVDYRAGDLLLFGRESTGLPEEVLADPRLAGRIRIPMLPGRRSLNLANAAAIVAYEAWRQFGFVGQVRGGGATHA